MNHAPPGAQVPNSVQLSIGVQPPTWTPAALNSLGPSDFKTPLGEPLNQLSAIRKAQFPVMWHLNYWLNMGIIGIFYGQDSMLMSVRIEIEIEEMPEEHIKIAIRNRWHQYRGANKQEYERIWARLTLESEEAKPYLRDIHKMLKNKLIKTKEYLQSAKEGIITCLRAGQMEEATKLFDKLAQLYQKLKDETAADAEARTRFLDSLPTEEVESTRRFLNHVDGVGNQGEPTLEVMEPDDISSGEEIWDEAESDEDNSDEAMGEV